MSWFVKNIKKIEKYIPIEKMEQKNYYYKGKIFSSTLKI